MAGFGTFADDDHDGDPCGLISGPGLHAVVRYIKFEPSYKF